MIIIGYTKDIQSEVLAESTLTAAKDAFNILDEINNHDLEELEEIKI